MKHFFTIGFTLVVAGLPNKGNATPTIARQWDDEIIEAIRIDTPHPPVHARNLFHFAVAMYDAWAAYDSTAVGLVYHAKPTAADVPAARNEALSFAAYRLLSERYALSKGAAATLAALDSKMTNLGYDRFFTSTDPSTPAGVGNAVAQALHDFFIEDGSRQLQLYQDFPPEEGGYVSVNLPMITTMNGTLAVDVNRWQRLAITNAQTQNGIPADSIQKFLGAHWRDTRPFALTRETPGAPWLSFGPPPALNAAGDQQFRDEVVEVIQKSSELSPDDGITMDISPGSWGNNPLGENTGMGHPLNPATNSPYSPNVVKRGDFSRVLAEFWADGPNSETPPGHWNVLANAVVEHPSFERRFGGTGPQLDPLEWDVKMYFALNAALHDAACAAWTVKRYYDGPRPVGMIRYMGQRGQSSDSFLPSYNPDGLPLVPGLVELVTPETQAVGGRHEGLPLYIVAIKAWPGQPLDPINEYSGVKWIPSYAWLPYQKKTFVTPAFPGYISGHSTFSRAAAEVMTLITGSPFFPGGMAVYTSPAESGLTFEKGPSVALQLQWATYYDAADQAGLSRLWGGIHVSADDLNGRRTGSACGQGAFTLAKKYFNGTIATEPVELLGSAVGTSQCVLHFPTTRGLYYKLQSSTDLLSPFVDHPSGWLQATESFREIADTFSGTRKFYRVVKAVIP